MNVFWRRNIKKLVFKFFKDAKVIIFITEIFQNKVRVINRTKFLPIWTCKVETRKYSELLNTKAWSGYLLTRRRKHVMKFVVRSRWIASCKRLTKIQRLKIFPPGLDFLALPFKTTLFYIRMSYSMASRWLKQMETALGATLDLATQPLEDDRSVPATKVIIDVFFILFPGTLERHFFNFSEIKTI